MNRIFSIVIAAFLASLALGLATGPAGPQLDWDMISSIRAPRVITAALAGAATAAAGAMSQSLFRNALATPSIIGTEAGASFAIALASLLIASDSQSLEAPVIYSTIGAALATLASLSLITPLTGRFKTRRNQVSNMDRMPRLLLGGFAINAFLAAGTALCVSILMERGTGMSVYHWLMGSFTARTWGNVWGLFAGYSVTIIFAWSVAPTVDVMSVGDDTAQTLGINVQKIYWQILILIAVLIGSALSCGGALPFIGLIAPHVARLFSKPQLRTVIVLASLIGATLTVLADLAARTVRAPVDMDVGILTTIIGAPYFIWLLQRREYR